MKLTDLMVGDWVFIKDYPIKALPKKVRPEHFVRSLVEFEPIPLTTEILEKNGFVRLGKQYNIWMCRGFGFSLKLVDGVFGYYEQGHPYYPTFITKYVHELQHALRLFGQNDLADNFKI